MSKINELSLMIGDVVKVKSFTTGQTHEYTIIEKTKDFLKMKAEGTVINYSLKNFCMMEIVSMKPAEHPEKRVEETKKVSENSLLQQIDYLTKQAKKLEEKFTDAEVSRPIWHKINYLKREYLQKEGVKNL